MLDPDESRGDGGSGGIGAGLDNEEAELETDNILKGPSKTDTT